LTLVAKQKKSFHMTNQKKNNKFLSWEYMGRVWGPPPARGGPKGGGIPSDPPIMKPKKKNQHAPLCYSEKHKKQAGCRLQRAQKRLGGVHTNRPVLRGKVERSTPTSRKTEKPEKSHLTEGGEKGKKLLIIIPMKKRGQLKALR